MEKIIYLLCSFISCVIIVSLLFQFLNDRFIKVYKSKFIYILVGVLSIFIIVCVNMRLNFLLNMITNTVLFGLISYFLYYEENNQQICRRVFETEAFFAIAIIAETLGVLLIDALFYVLNNSPADVVVQKSIETLFSKIVILFFYYVVFNRFWKKNKSFIRMHYKLYAVMFIYSITSFLAISTLSSKENPITLMVIISCTIFANMYLLYFIKFSEERNYYKQQYDMMVQQEKYQFNSYEIQKDKYVEAISIIHDVDKHIKMMENLWIHDKNDEVMDYAKQIRGMISPLAPYQYTDSSILNCVLTDKFKTAEKLGITIKVDIDDVDITFMKPIDITTLFGNLFDNAINAAKQCKDSKYVGFFLKAYNDMISIRIENSISKPITIKNGTLIYEKEHEQSGIGILNIQKCIESYDGNLIYKVSNEILKCDIMINKNDI